MVCRTTRGVLNNILTFVQSLPKLFVREEQCVVASIPESDKKIGGEAGKMALEDN
jgi:hypothetical protein